jgi:hypothetical protein
MPAAREPGRGASKQSLQARIRKPSGTGPVDFACSKSLMKIPCGRRASKRARLFLRSCRGSFRKSSPRARGYRTRKAAPRHRAGVKTRPLKSENSVDAKQDGFAIQHKGSGPDVQGGFDNEGISVGPVVAVPGEQPHALALELNEIISVFKAWMAGTCGSSENS